MLLVSRGVAMVLRLLHALLLALAIVYSLKEQVRRAKILQHVRCAVTIHLDDAQSPHQFAALLKQFAQSPCAHLFALLR